MAEKILHLAKSEFWKLVFNWPHVVTSSVATTLFKRPKTSINELNRSKVSIRKNTFVGQWGFV